MLAIIISYYKLTFFQECLQSLAAQTDQRFTVYIGDDASPENPAELLKEFEGKFNFVYKRFKDNLGGTSLTKQWERCIEMMQDEEWLMILGDDDFLCPDSVKDFFKNLSTIEYIGVNVLSLQYVQINEQSETVMIFPPITQSEFAINLFCDKIRNINLTSLSQYIFRKKQYEKFKFVDFPLAWGSDDLAILQYAEDAKVYPLKAIVYVRMSSQNISGNRTLTGTKVSSLLKLYGSIFTGSYIKTAKQGDICSDQYFNILLENGKVTDFFRFFLQTAFKTSSRKWLYFVKVLINKSTSTVTA